MKTRRFLSLVICTFIMILIGTFTTVGHSAAAPSVQEQQGDWDTAVEHNPWTFAGYDVTRVDEAANTQSSDNLDYMRWLRADHPDKIANEFRVTPWVYKFSDHDPNRDWYLLDMKMLTDANIDVLFMYERGNYLGWRNSRRVLGVSNGADDPGNTDRTVFLIDWAPKLEPQTHTTSSTVGINAGCGVSATVSGNTTAGAKCDVGFTASKTTMEVVSDTYYESIAQQQWSPQRPQTLDSIWWTERIKGPGNGRTLEGLPGIASGTYVSNRMMIWETSTPLNGALLEMYMWATFEHDFRAYFLGVFAIGTDRQCLGFFSGPEDHRYGCVNGHEGDQTTLGSVPFRLVQYRPPVIAIGQKPSAVSPVWVNQSVGVSFNPATDPDGDNLLYQFNFSDGTSYPSQDCASNPDADGCRDEVCYDVCVDKACATKQQECLHTQCDADGCFSPSRNPQHTWTGDNPENLMGPRDVRVRAAEAQCFPPSPGAESPCVQKARDYGTAANYNYKSGWSDSFPVTIQGLSDISIQAPTAGVIWAPYPGEIDEVPMYCRATWFNAGTPTGDTCDHFGGSVSWSVNDNAYATIDQTSGKLTVVPLGSRTHVNITVTARVTDHGMTKEQSLALRVENHNVVLGGQTMTVSNAPLESGVGEEGTVPPEGPQAAASSLGGEAPTLNDKLAECEALGGEQALACVLNLTTEWVASGLITEQEKQEIDGAAQSLWGAGLTTTARPLNMPSWVYIAVGAAILLSLGGWGWLKWRQGRVTR